MGRMKRIEEVHSVQNLEFLRNDYMPLAHKALPLWISLLSSAERAQRGAKEEMLVPLESAAVLMDLAGVSLQCSFGLSSHSPDP